MLGEKTHFFLCLLCPKLFDDVQFIKFDLKGPTPFMRDINDHLLKAHHLDNYFSFEDMKIEKIEIDDDLLKILVLNLAVLPGFPDYEYPTFYDQCTLIYEGINAIEARMTEFTEDKKDFKDTNYFYQGVISDDDNYFYFGGLCLDPFSTLSMNIVAQNVRIETYEPNIDIEDISIYPDMQNYNFDESTLQGISKVTDESIEILVANVKLLLSDHNKQEINIYDQTKLTFNKVVFSKREISSKMSLLSQRANEGMNNISDSNKSIVYQGPFKENNGNKYRFIFSGKLPPVKVGMDVSFKGWFLWEIVASSMNIEPI